MEQPAGRHRREGEGIEGGEHDRAADREGDRGIEPPQAALQGEHRQEHRDQHQGGGHHGAAQLRHRLPGRLQGGAALLQAAADVFAHHDGVVHHQAGGQHHAEQGEGVDRVAAEVQHRQAADQGHRHRQGADHRQAAVAQPQQQHQEHQQHRVPQAGGGAIDAGADRVGLIHDQLQVHPRAGSGGPVRRGRLRCPGSPPGRCCHPAGRCRWRWWPCPPGWWRWSRSSRCPGSPGPRP